MPIAIGAKDKKEIISIRNVVWSNNLVIMVLTSLVLWGAFLAGVNPGNTFDHWMVMMVTAILWEERLATLLDAELKSRGLFESMARRSVVSGVLFASLSIAGVLLFGIKGILLGWVIGYAVVVMFLVTITKVSVRFQFSLSRTRSLLSVGLPISLWGVSSNAFRLGTLTVVAAMASVEYLGLFGMAMGALVMTDALMRPLYTVIHRQALVERGRLGSTDMAFLRRCWQRPFVMSVFLSALSAGAIFFVYQAGVTLFLPDFSDSLILLQILLFGFLFEKVARFGLMSLSVLGRLWQTAFIQFALVPFHILLTFFLVREFGTTGAAIAFVVTNILLAGALMVLVARDLNWRPMAYGLRILQVLISSSIVGAMIFGVAKWQTGSPEGWKFSPEVLGMGVGLPLSQGVVFLVGCLLTFSLLYKAPGLIRDFRMGLVAVVRPRPSR